MADPQHPDIAAPTLAQMPALIAKHDEFAALAAEHGHEEMAALHAVTAAALRFLTRPVEDEEVRRLIDHLENGPLDGSHLGEAASILASLVRERDEARGALRDVVRDYVTREKPLSGPTLAKVQRALAAAAGAEEPR